MNYHQKGFIRGELTEEDKEVLIVMESGQEADKAYIYMSNLISNRICR